ncbi:uncharacterized protein BO66DRAFT_85262 [Aspergillus aculeatinus CBS 121060]|uniref:Uncharacterized protein n=1 Tax=Aspergillus aculeatinus CBS 121060 TaxID=1448322 RepID=A0ACD1H9E3_9EURO|nr:hypothetical protein BO66DRAFT_85262 [Aspergillus aculeatinus CBS 121060]RAH70279.1 hypothetical protein BO66DRAFT_85262 [Aspergillus aculeatinus CBS 121060]
MVISLHFAVATRPTSGIWAFAMSSSVQDVQAGVSKMSTMILAHTTQERPLVRPSRRLESHWNLSLFSSGLASGGTLQHRKKPRDMLTVAKRDCMNLAKFKSLIS